MEGPVILQDGCLIVTDVEHGTLLVVDRESGKIETLVETKGGPNGTALGPDWALYVCNNGGMAFTSHSGMKASDLTESRSQLLLRESSW